MKGKGLDEFDWNLGRGSAKGKVCVLSAISKVSRVEFADMLKRLAAARKLSGQKTACDTVTRTASQWKSLQTDETEPLALSKHGRSKGKVGTIR